MTVVPSPFIHLSLVLILLLFANLGICQLLPMPRLFSTSVEVNGELEHPTEFSKYDPIYTGTDLSLRYPLISRLGISVDLKNITKPGKTGGIRRFVTPLASQVIAVVNVGYREMKFRQTPVMEFLRCY